MKRTKIEDMKYGQVAGNRSINAKIYQCFEYISEEDALKFVRKFRDQLDDEVQVMHTFRELLLGAYLGSCRLNIRYNYAINTETPDWCIMSEASALKGIVELTNFHIDRTKEIEIKQHLRARGMWTGRLGSNDTRLYNSIWNKAQKYKALVERCRVPYIIALFGEFTADVEPDELQRCLFDQEIGLFELYPTVSCILFFEERAGRYLFRHFPNPNAQMPMEVPNGEF